jgi:hypothetical protein
MINRQPSYIYIEFGEVDDDLDFASTPEAVLRAKSELLADFLGCDVDSAERLLLDRVTDIGV